MAAAVLKTKSPLQLEGIELNGNDVLVTVAGKVYKLPPSVQPLGKRALEAIAQGAELPTHKAGIEDLLRTIATSSGNNLKAADLIDKVMVSLLKQLRQADALEEFTDKIAEQAARNISMDKLAAAVADEITDELAARMPRALIES